MLDLAYSCVPPCLWRAPLPLVGLAADWNLLWHGYRRVLPLCERVLTDAPGVGVMPAAAGRTAGPPTSTGRSRPCWGCRRTGPSATSTCCSWATHTRRCSASASPGWAALPGSPAAGAWRSHAGVFGDDYRDLLCRARVVFNRSVRGECNRRAFEAAACGALLFQERGNAETPDYFRDRAECVYYGADDLEALLERT